MIQRWYFHNHTEALGLKNKSGLIKKTSLDPDKRLLFAKIKHTPDGFLLTQQYRMRLLITQLSEFRTICWHAADQYVASISLCNVLPPSLALLTFWFSSCPHLSSRSTDLTDSVPPRLIHRLCLTFLKMGRFTFVLRLQYPRLRVYYLLMLLMLGTVLGKKSYGDQELAKDI